MDNVRLDPIIERILVPLHGTAYSDRSNLENAIMSGWNSQPDAFARFPGESYRIALETGMRVGWIQQRGDHYQINVPDAVRTYAPSHPAVRESELPPIPPSEVQPNLSPRSTYHLVHISLQPTQEIPITPDTPTDYRELLAVGFIEPVYRLTEKGRRFLLQSR